MAVLSAIGLKNQEKKIDYLISRIQFLNARKWNFVLKGIFCDIKNFVKSELLLDGWMDGWVGGWIDGPTYRLMDHWMSG